MNVSKIDLPTVQIFSRLFINYVQQATELEDFQSQPPTLQGLSDKVHKFNFAQDKRMVLHQTITKQYQQIDQTEHVSKNIAALLHPETYTVTTGHQLNIFTGPLYFIYKIISTINLAKALEKEFPNRRFVPVYWMASEDHDYEEINHVYLFGKKLVWNTEQKGAVGNFNTAGIAELLDEISEKMPLLEAAYQRSSTLAEATRIMVNEIFGKYGLVTLDANERDLKQLFKPIMKQELVEQTCFTTVSNTINALENLGYKTQAAPREINLFYLDKNLRERLILEDGNYKVNNTSVVFTPDEMIEHLEKYPEKFSPNVLLRPLYQETVLPNLAYVGGPAEIIYWLQLKTLFQHFDTPFPVLIPRNFVLYIGKSFSKKLQKLQLMPEDLFLKEDVLKAKFLGLASGDLLSLSTELQQLEKSFETISTKAQKVDSSLVGYVMAEKQKVVKIINEIARRLKKSEEKKNSDHIQQLEALKSKLFPADGLQERTDNFLNFYINDPMFIDKLIETLDPLDMRFNILEETTGV